MVDAGIVGLRTESKTISVEEGQLKLFAKATGESNPIHFELDAALKAGYPAILAPPTFLFTLDLLCMDKSNSILKRLRVDISRILHGEQRFIYGKPIFSGDRITISRKVVDAYDKKDGALSFVVTDIGAVNQHGDDVGRMIYTMVIRN